LALVVEDGVWSYIVETCGGKTLTGHDWLGNVVRWETIGHVWYEAILARRLADHTFSVVPPQAVSPVLASHREALAWLHEEAERWN
jgi:hypothetical protein